mgnify:CR=1 FL=1
MLDLLTDIKNNPVPQNEEKAYLTRQLVQATLPHSDLHDQDVFESYNGALTLTIQAGYNAKTKQKYGLPYGTIPRLLLFWLTSEVMKTKSRKIYLGDNMSQFMKEIGLDPRSRGPRSDAARLKDQMNRLFNSIICFTGDISRGTRTGDAWHNMQIAPKGVVWWDTEKLEQGDHFESYIELGEGFYEAILNSPVPLDKRALTALKNSSMTLDIYSWSVYKSFALSKQRKEKQFITWYSFMEQLGANYSDIKNFKKKVKQAFDKVGMVYPWLHIEYVTKGFEIFASHPAIPEQKKRCS